MKILKKKQSGFTLLEMSIVLFIISLLVLLFCPSSLNSESMLIVFMEKR